MKNQLDLYELPSWRIVSIGRDRNSGEDLMHLIGHVENVFSKWFNNRFPEFQMDTNNFSLSHGAIWESDTIETPNITNFHLFALAHQKIMKFKDVCKFATHNGFLEGLDIFHRYISGGLYARTTAGNYSEISYIVENFISNAINKSHFNWNGNPCIEVYREPYPKKLTDDAIQIFIPVCPNDSNEKGKMVCCSYCGKSYPLDKDNDLRNCCRQYKTEICFQNFGNTCLKGE